MPSYEELLQENSEEGVELPAERAAHKLVELGLTLRLSEDLGELADEIPEAVEVQLAAIEHEQPFDVGAVAIAPSERLVDHQVFGKGDGDLDSGEAQRGGLAHGLALERQPGQADLDRRPRRSVPQQEHRTSSPYPV